MNYCTLADIDASNTDLVDLTDDNGSGGIDQTVIAKAIANVGELIDGYLRGRYSLPLNPIPGLLVPLAADMALYSLYARKPRLSIPDSLDKKNSGAIKILENIQNGKILLGVSSPEQVLTDGPRSMVKASTQIFSDDVLSKF